MSVIGRSPEFDNSPGDKRFRTLVDTRIFDIGWIRGCVRRRVIVLKSRYMDVVAIVRMLAPTNVHLRSVCIVIFVVVSCCPLNIDP